MRNSLHPEGTWYLVLCLLLTLVSCQNPGSPATDFTPTPKEGSPTPQKPEFVVVQREAAPLGLTTSEGTGLRLMNLDARAYLEGPLAFTELRLTFENPQDRVIEGRFEIALPDRAAISRFAMKIDDRWQEAEVVERQAAQVAYEDFLHRRQDPALLEKEAGNEFRARVFPIPARGAKELIISYSQELESSTTPYLLPLQGLPKVGHLRLEVRRGGAGAKPFVVEHKDFEPQGDFAVPQDGKVSGLISGEVAVARVRPALGNAAGELKDLVILFDTSASRALGFTDQVETVSDLVKSVPELENLTVAAFDQEIEVVSEGGPSKFSPDSLLKRKALGATDLSAALKWAAGKKHTRLLLVTDGISTAGPEELAKALEGSSLQRVDVLLVGGIRDKEKMERLVGDALPQHGGVFSDSLAPNRLTDKLRLSVSAGLDVSVEGAKWVWPQTLDGVQPGDERLIYAQLSKPEKEIAVSLEGQAPIKVFLQPSAAPPLLSRSVAVAQVARLEASRDATKEIKEKEALAAEIIKLSTSHRMLSDLTAFLVLETEEDYRRFSIDRKSLVDILELGPNGLVLKARDDFALLPTPRVKPVAPRAAERKFQTTSGPLGRGMGMAAPTASPVTTDSIEPGADATVHGGVENEIEARHYERLPNVQRRIDTRPEPVSSAPSSEGSTGGDYLREIQEGERLGGAMAMERRRAEPELDPNLLEEASRRLRTAETSAPEQSLGETERDSALNGKSAEIAALLKKGKVEDGLKKAWAWRQSEPGDVLALLALGDCFEAQRDLKSAARVYGSIIDLFPSRADLRRFAGSRLEHLGKVGMPLAVDTFTKAVVQRPDHVSSHRFLAMAYARELRYEEAFAALEKGLSQDYPSDRFAGWEKILREDLQMIGAAWLARSPKEVAVIKARLQKFGAAPADKPSLRFIMTWETDANDVDFHIDDSKEGHAFYSSPDLPSGGSLYADVTTGYGPECFAIEGKPQAFPYKLKAHYYSRGPMGYGMGQLEILQHDGKGGLLFEERPYLVMEDQAYVDLGEVEGPLVAR